VSYDYLTVCLCWFICKCSLYIFVMLSIISFWMMSSMMNDEKIFENIFNHTHISEGSTRIYLKENETINPSNRPITDRLSFQECYCIKWEWGFLWIIPFVNWGFLLIMPFGGWGSLLIMPFGNWGFLLIMSSRDYYHHHHIIWVLRLTRR